MSGYFLRGQSRWGVDLTVARKLRVTERTNVRVSGQFFNLFNNVQFADPGLSLQLPQSFGVITSQVNQPRRIEIGLHVIF